MDMRRLHDPDDVIRITRGEALEILKEALMSEIVLSGKDETEYAALAIDLAAQLVTHQITPVQRQDSLFDQLRDLAAIAEREHGMYDAADWIRKAIEIREGFEALVPLIERYGTVTGRLPSDQPHVEEVDRD